MYIFLPESEVWGSSICWFSGTVVLLCCKSDPNTPVTPSLLCCVFVECCKTAFVSSEVFAKAVCLKIKSRGLVQCPLEAGLSLYLASNLVF